MAQNEQSLRIRRLTATALMAALVFVGTYLRIKIPVGLDGTMLHFGNVFGILAGLLFGPVSGGLAAGLGSAIFDLTSEYAAEAWITFINKFAMGFMAGLLARQLLAVRHSLPRYILSALGGSVTYCVLYLLKNLVWNLWVTPVPVATIPAILLTKGIVTLTNGVIAVIASILFAKALHKPLLKLGTLPAWHRETKAD